MILRPASYRRPKATIRNTKEVTDDLKDAQSVIRKVMEGNAILESALDAELGSLTWGGAWADDRVVNLACVQGNLRGDCIN